MSDRLHAFQGIEVFADRLEVPFRGEPCGRLRAETIPEFDEPVPFKLRMDYPLIRKLALLAAHDVRLLNYEDRYFACGASWSHLCGIVPPIVFTRDLALSGVLFLNRICPELMRRSLRFTRQVREELGFTVSRDHRIPLAGLACQALDVSEKEFGARFHASSYTRRTDDVVWIWAYRDLMGDNPDPAEWTYLYDTAVRFFARFYAPFFCDKTGLYRGQSLSVDAGGGLPWYGHPATIGDCVLGMAAATNALYYRALGILAEAAGRLGRHDEAGEWTRRGERLRQAFQERFVAPDGSVRFLVRDDGTVIPNRHPFSAALPALFDMLGDPARALAGCPVHAYGASFFDPFFGTQRTYHDNCAWPHADAFLHLAKSRAVADRNTLLDWLALIARYGHGSDGFMELTAADAVGEHGAFQGKLMGSGHMLWTAAAFLRCVYELGWIEPAPA